jgi:peptidyl-prolyl cis-trans isomerase A (cyclophilin A)/peptidyl-prolyl cis-trans isomerase B (cyclophilin B)
MHITRHIMKLIPVLLLLCSTASSVAGEITHPQVEIKTNLGSMILELYPDKAPKTVENFLQYVKDGYYAGTIFHRVIPRFMIQGGGMDKEFRQKPTRQPVGNEAANGLKNDIGMVSMARTSDPHSASSQFFINVANNAFLNHTAPTPQGYGYTVFGKVVKGMDVVNRIAGAPTGPGGPFPADVPRSTVIIEDARLLPESPQRAGTPGETSSKTNP